MDSSGQLNEYTEKLLFDDVIQCLAIGRVKIGALRAPYLAVGFSSNMVRVFSLQPNDCLKQICIQALPETPSSLCLCNVGTKITPNKHEKSNKKSAALNDAFEFNEVNLFIGTIF